jgi:hypothetical protein
VDYRAGVRACGAGGHRVTPRRWRPPGHRPTPYLTASGLIGEPTAPVIGKGSAEKKNAY